MDATTKRTSGLRLEVLPLVPVFETADQQGELVRWASRWLHSRLKAQFPRGQMVGELRWVRDAKRTPAATWNDAAACGVLETTLLTHPLLSKDRIDHAPGSLTHLTRDGRGGGRTL